MFYFSYRGGLPAATKENEMALAIRELTDEDLDDLLALVNLTRNQRDSINIAGVAADAVDAEVARRAEIRINRRMDIDYGANPYGWTVDEISQQHDASWYGSRQTEEQWLGELGEVGQIA